MRDKIYCPILLTECRFELCPYYYDEEVKYITESWIIMGGGYEVRSGCNNPMCKSAFTARKAKLSEIEKDGTKLYPWYASKYED